MMKMNSFDKYRIKNIPCSEKLASDLDKEQLQAVCAPLSNTCVFAVFIYIKNLLYIVDIPTI